MIPAIWKIKGTVLRWSCPLFFKSIGRGTLFTGRVRLPMPFRTIEIGQNCMIGHDVYFQTGRDSTVSLGDEVSINSGGHVIASERISIGNNVAIGEFVSIRDQDHKFRPDRGVRGQGFTVAPVEISDNVWIGRGVYIGPGSKIGSGSIVAANSVVHGQFPPNSLIAGAPATVRRTINPDGSRSAPEPSN
ncbi:acyltransferase [Tropicibacter sp. R15_0]|uniref:acyltransferase n=1 Tax=Tropicibacter sp. R15_0 TaxID=2821101 RepID=UPI001ADB03D5|nr:acyltransferase [Tropicibacter sp. R15_0]MBO9467525.1 acyltransferase [Tropicibacter sp. R15_0]